MLNDKGKIYILYQEDPIYRVKNPKNVDKISMVIHHANRYSIDPDQCMELAHKEDIS